MEPPSVGCRIHNVPIRIHCSTRLEATVHTRRLFRACFAHLFLLPAHERHWVQYLQVRPLGSFHVQHCNWRYIRYSRCIPLHVSLVAAPFLNFSLTSQKASRGLLGLPNDEERQMLG